MRRSCLLHFQRLASICASSPANKGLAVEKRQKRSSTRQFALYQINPCSLLLFQASSASSAPDFCQSVWWIAGRLNRARQHPNHSLVHSLHFLLSHWITLVHCAERLDPWTNADLARLLFPPLSNPETYLRPQCDSLLSGPLLAVRSFGSLAAATLFKNSAHLLISSC